MVDSPGQKGAPSPLLQTKLYIPKSRPGLVPRPRLTERLNKGTRGKLTLVSAPAGFGKTTMLAEWLVTAEAGTGPAAWVALDQNDTEPSLFWAYVIAALQSVHAEVGTRTLSLLESPQPLPVETLLGTLVNEISASSRRAGARRLPPDRRAAGPAGHRFSARPPAATVAPGHRWPR